MALVILQEGFETKTKAQRGKVKQKRFFHKPRFCYYLGPNMSSPIENTWPEVQNFAPQSIPNCPPNAEGCSHFGLGLDPSLLHLEECLEIGSRALGENAKAEHLEGCIRDLTYGIKCREKMGT